MFPHLYFCINDAQILKEDNTSKIIGHFKNDIRNIKMSFTPSEYGKIKCVLNEGFIN